VTRKSSNRKPLIVAAAVAAGLGTVLLGLFLDPSGPEPGGEGLGDGVGARDDGPGDPTVDGPGRDGRADGADGAASDRGRGGEGDGPAGGAGEVPDAGPLGPAGPAFRALVRGARGPLPGAEVRATSPEGGGVRRRVATSGPDGRFALAELPPGGLLEVSADGYASQIVPAFEPRVGAVITLVAARRVEGEVTAAEDGRPLEGARVAAQATTWRGTARTDALGRFALEGAPEGEALNLHVSHPGRVSAVVSEGEGLTVALERGRAVRGTVVGPDGRPRPARVLAVGAAQLTTPHEAVAGPDGRFEVWGIAPDEDVALLATADGHASRAELAFHPPRADDLEVAVLERGDLTVRSAPAGRLVVFPVDVGDTFGEALAADGARRYHAFRLPAGRYQLELAGEAAGPVFTVEPGADVVLDWAEHTGGAPAEADGPTEEAPPQPPVRVQVVDAIGQPVPHVPVVASYAGNGGGDARATTDAGGWVVFEGLPTGLVTFSASRAGRVLRRAVVYDPEEGPAAAGEATLVLARPAELRGTIQPPRSYGLRVTLPEDDAEIRLETSHPDGAFRLLGLPPGPVVLEVTADDRVPVTLQLDLPVDGPLSIRTEEMGHEHGHGEHH